MVDLPAKCTADFGLLSFFDQAKWETGQYVEVVGA